ncbi:MAG: phage holin family protein [bacterium]|nr:phage holin family protein [bacterium]
MLKSFIRRLIYSTVTIYLLTLINQGFSYSGGMNTLLLAGFVMFFLSTIVGPVLKIITFPINLLTAGLFSWLIAAALFYLLAYFVPAIRINHWDFKGFTLPLLTFYSLKIPPFYFVYWANLVLLSFLFTTISGFLNWLSD